MSEVDIEGGSLPPNVKAATGSRVGPSPLWPELRMLERYARILAKAHAQDGDVLGAYARTLLGQESERDALMIADEEDRIQ